MNGATFLEELKAKQRQGRIHRLEAVKEWAKYVKEQPVEVWGPQQNQLINSYLESARDADLSVDQWRQVADAKADRRPA